MKYTRILSLLALIPALTRPSAQTNLETQKEQILSVVTTSKHVQKIITDYLDLPDHLMHFSDFWQHHHIGQMGISDSLVACYNERLIDHRYICGFIDLHDPITHTLVQSINKPVIAKTRRGKSSLNTGPCSLDFSANGKYIALAVGYSKYVPVINANTGNVVMTCDSSHHWPHIFFSPDSNYIACIASNGAHGAAIQLRVFEIQTQKQLIDTAIRTPDSHIFSADSAKIICGYADQNIWLVNLKTQQSSMFKPQNHQPIAGELKQLSASADGKYLACSYKKNAFIYDLQTGIQLFELGKPGSCLFTPDGKYLVTLEGEYLALRDPKTFQTLSWLLSGLKDYSLVRATTLANGAYLLAQIKYETLLFETGKLSKFCIFKNQATDLDGQAWTHTEAQKTDCCVIL